MKKSETAQKNAPEGSILYNTKVSKVIVQYNNLIGGK
jgi:hypothetical protein